MSDIDYLRDCVGFIERGVSQTAYLEAIDRLEAAITQAKDAFDGILVRKDQDWQAQAVRALHVVSDVLK